MIRGHGFIQNLRRGHYEVGVDAASVPWLATIEDGDIRHAITHAVFSDDIDPEPPVRRLHLGRDPAGNML